MIEMQPTKLFDGDISRVYIIKYRLYASNEGAFKYATKPKYEECILYFPRLKRDEFIKKYKGLKEYESQGKVDNIETFISIPEKIENMKEIIEAL